MESSDQPLTITNGQVTAGLLKSSSVCESSLYDLLAAQQLPGSALSP